MFHARNIFNVIKVKESASNIVKNEKYNKIKEAVSVWHSFLKLSEPLRGLKIVLFRAISELSVVPVLIKSGDIARPFKQKGFHYSYALNTELSNI